MNSRIHIALLAALVMVASAGLAEEPKELVVLRLHL